MALVTRVRSSCWVKRLSFWDFFLLALRLELVVDVVAPEPAAMAVSESDFAFELFELFCRYRLGNVLLNIRVFITFF